MRIKSPLVPSSSRYFRLPFLIAAIAVVTATTWMLGWRYVEQSLITMAGEGLALAARDIAEDLDRTLLERYGDLRILSKVLSNRVTRDIAYMQAHISWMLDAYKGYHWLAVVDRNGRLVASSSPAMIGTDVGHTKWFQESRSRALRGLDAAYVGEVESFVTERGAPDSISFSTAIYDGMGRFEGVVTSLVSIAMLEQLALQTIQSVQTSNSTLAHIDYQILDHRGRVYIDSDLEHKGLMNVGPLHLPSVELSRQGRSGFIEEDQPGHRGRVLTGYSQTHGWGQANALTWTVLVRIPTASLIAPMQTYHFKIGAAGVLILLPIFALLVWMQQRLRGEWLVAQAERLRATSVQGQYHLLLQTTDQGIFGLDDGGRCTFINRAAAEMLGYSGNRLLGQPLHEKLYHGDGTPCVPDICPMQQLITHGQAYRLTEHILWRNDGSALPVEGSAFPLNDSQSTTRFVVTFMDVRERNERTQALLQYQEQLQSLASQLRKTEENVRQRLATDLHDNLAQMLALCRMKLGSLNRTAPETLKGSLTSVVDLINEALRYTRELMSDLRPPMLGDERDLGAAVQWVTEKLERYGLTVTVIDDHRHKPLDADVLRIAYQSLHELLFNVLKHAGTASATVLLRRFDHYFIMEVRDRGAGFREAALRAPTGQGGFGLFNMREQIQRAGGRMKIKSTPSSGSRVVIVLPLQAGAPVAQTGGPAAETGESLSPHPTEKHATIRILLVDDHQIMREGLRSMIEGEKDCEVIAEAGDGQMAVELATTLRPDVIVMDINMPRVNGLEATRRIKRMMPEIAIIGLSVQEDPTLEQFMYEAGASAYLSKGTAFNLVCDTIRQAYFKQQQHA